MGSQIEVIKELLMHDITILFNELVNPVSCLETRVAVRVRFPS